MGGWLGTRGSKGSKTAVETREGQHYVFRNSSGMAIAICKGSRLSVKDVCLSEG